MTWPLAGLLLLNAKHAVRQLVRYPLFSIVAVLSLVIGIGARSARIQAAEPRLSKPLRCL